MRTTATTLALFLLVSGLVCAGAALASTPSPGGNPWDSETMPSASAITRTATLVIKAIEDDRTLRLFDAKSEEEIVIQLPADVPVKAQRKKDFDGRKKLDFADLEAGQKLKLTYRAEDGQIVQIKVLARA